MNIDSKILAAILILATYINLVKPIFGTRYAPLLVDAILALLFIRIVFEKAARKAGSLVVVPNIEFFLLLFFIISLIQIFNPNVPVFQAGLEGFRKTTYQMLGVFIGIYYIKNRLEVEKIAKYICYASVPVLVYGIKQFFFFSSFDQRIVEANFADWHVLTILGESRAISIFSGPFHFGMFSCVIALIALYFYVKEKRLLYLVLCIISVTGPFFSLTRTNIVALVVSGLFFLWFVKPEKRRVLMKVNIVFVLLLAGFILISSQKFSTVTDVLKTFKNISEDQRFLIRFEGYREIQKAFVKNPVIGYGMGSAGDTLGKLYDWKVHITSHNLGLKILMETGLLGFGIYISFFFAWFKKALDLFKAKNRHIRNLSVLITSMLLVVLVNGVVGSAVGAYPINLYVWFFMGALLKVWWLENRIRIGTLS